LNKSLAGCGAGDADALLGGDALVVGGGVVIVVEGGLPPPTSTGVSSLAVLS
jgi:hypothetical protein